MVLRTWLLLLSALWSIDPVSSLTPQKRGRPTLSSSMRLRYPLKVTIGFAQHQSAAVMRLAVVSVVPGAVRPAGSAVQPGVLSDGLSAWPLAWLLAALVPLY